MVAPVTIVLTIVRSNLMTSPHHFNRPCLFTKANSTTNPGGGVCLFNIAEDPREMCDLAAANPDMVSKMMLRLEQYNATAVPVRFPNGVGAVCNPDHFGGAIQWWVQ